VKTSVKTSGDSVTTPLAVRCGSGIGTRTALTFSPRMVGDAGRAMTFPDGAAIVSRGGP
jgi:hypothetical protein